MRSRAAKLAMLAFGAGLLLAASIRRLDEGAVVAREDVRVAKITLLKSADLERIHHQVYEQVGERRWEEEVKPEFLREVTARTIRETGNPFPHWTDVAWWVQTHPSEANALLDRYRIR